MTESADRLYDQARKACAAGDWAAAARLCRRLLGLVPDHKRGLLLSALVARAQGRTEAALAGFRRVVDLNPASASGRFHLAETLAGSGDEEAALALLTALGRDRPDLARVPLLVSEILARLGRLAEAESRLADALRARPDDLEIGFALGALQHRAGHLSAAAETYRAILARAPGLTAAHNNLGLVLRDLGRLSAAAEAFGAAIRLDPTEAVCHRNLGLVLRDLDRHAEGLAALNAAARLDDRDPETPFAAATVFARMGRETEAVERFEHALSRDPAAFHARWGARLALPIAYDDEDALEAWHRRWRAGLADLEQTVDLGSAAGRRAALRAISTFTNFYLPYQGRADVDLHRRLGGLITRIAEAAFPGHQRPCPPARRRVRVGFVSSLLRTHTVAKLFAGWVTGLERQHFDVWLFYSGRRVDKTTRALAVDRLVSGLRAPERLIAAIGRVAPDILIYPDIGMDPIPQAAAALRLAPRQYVGWGHPVTTGLANIDGFLTAAAMEPPDGDDHYTEPLIRLPGLSVSFARPAMPAPAARRDGGPVTYLCSQSLYKLLPRYDWVFARIARLVPGSRFRFIAHKADAVTAVVQERFARAFTAEGLDAEARCDWLPPCSQDAFLALNRAADIGLDSLEWSGGVTCFEAIAAGLPVVTWPGPLMRGRHSAAILRHIGLDALIAASPDDYVAIAARLGNAPEDRAAIRATLAANAARAFATPEPLRALNRFLRPR